MKLKDISGAGGNVLSTVINWHLDELREADGSVPLGRVCRTCVCAASKYAQGSWGGSTCTGNATSSAPRTGAFYP